MSATSTDSDRIAALEARVAALEADSGADQLQGNVLTVGPGGLIGASFSGVVDALGLYIPEASGTLGAQNCVLWPRAGQVNPDPLSNPPPFYIGAQLATLTMPGDGSSQPSDYAMVQASPYFDRATWASTHAAIDLLGGPRAKLRVESDQSLGAGASARNNRVQASAAGYARDVLRGDGTSDFALAGLAAGFVSGQPVSISTTAAQIAAITVGPQVNPGGRYVIFGGFSQYATTLGTVLSYIQIDHDNYAQPARLVDRFYFNQAGVHVKCCSFAWLVTLPIAQHTIGLIGVASGGGNFTADPNDFAYLLAVEIP